MPTWVKYGIAFIAGILVARDPSILNQLLHSVEHILNGIGQSNGG